MDNRELVARSAQSMAAVWSNVAESSGGRVHRWDDAVAVDAGAPSVVPNRTTLIAKAADDGEDVVRRAREFYGPTPWGIVDAWDSIDLSNYGCKLLVRMPLMVYQPGSQQPAPAETDLNIVRVEDDETFAAFRRALFSSFDLVPWPDESHALFGRSFYENPSIDAWVGFHGDEPVGTSVSLRGHGIVGVYLVSVHPTRRGRGVGEALSWAATLSDPTVPAVLQASTQGFSVYERMGYRVIGNAAFWIPEDR